MNTLDILPNQVSQVNPQEPQQQENHPNDPTDWMDGLSDGEAPKTKLKLKSLAELSHDCEPPKTLVRGLLPLPGIVWFYGMWSSFKSFVALNLAVCVASGLPWCGRDTRKSGVVYLAGEGHRSVTHRLMALKLKNNLSPDLPLWVSDKGGQLDEEGVEEVTSVIKALGKEIGLIIIDTQARWQVGEENSNSESRLFVDCITRLAEEHNATVVVVHHTDKNGNGLRGAGNYAGSADAILRVDKKVEDGERWAVLKVEKMKDGKDDQLFGLLGEEYTLPPPWRDECGDPISTLVFHHEDYQNRERVKLEQEVLDIVREHPGGSQTMLKKEMKNLLGIGVNKAVKVLDDLVDQGKLKCESEGAGRPKCYTVSPGHTAREPHGRTDRPEMGRGASGEDVTFTALPVTPNPFKRTPKAYSRA
ncbi:MAG: AAA family ATPase [Verrucomicrobia bacterium]|nr:AAA family ATPase [Verrucomicrobiota bacterium]MCH8511661.1 helicase RepA family protein [Kiritimatiellia bacterium]